MKKLCLFCLTLLLTVSLAVCSTGTNSIAENPSEITENAAVTATTSSSADDLIESAVEAVTSTSPISYDTHEESSDTTWNAAEEIAIVLSGGTASADNATVKVDGSNLTITAGGTYRLNGNLADGQVIVDADDGQVVRLILDNVEISSSTSSPLYVANAEKVVLILAENSRNVFSDADNYIYSNPEDKEPNAVLFSTANLSVYGNGELTINANFNDGIASKDGLLIAGGIITVSAVDDGIRGKDYVVIKDGTIEVTATGDGLTADNEEDTGLGYILIENGELKITSGGDAISAKTAVEVNNGILNLASGGGSGTWLDENLSAKGIKGLTSVVINGGNLSINSADDSLHSNEEIIINNGTLQLASGDDGMHADTSLTVNDGEIVVSQSYEGLESALVTINGGTVHINANDDGINVASGVDGSGGMFGGRPGGGPGAGPGQDMFAEGGDYYLYINGGYVVVNAEGDGIDSNGGIVMTNGIVLVNGPTNNGNGAFDYMSNFSISGGLLVAVGSAGMAQAPSAESAQNSVLINLDSPLAAGTIINIQDRSGNNLLTFTPLKTYQSVAFSSPDLESGNEYTINIGGNVNGEVADGLSTTDGYTGGSQYTSFSVSGSVTLLGTASGYGPGGMPGGGGGRH